jgi:CubicO group peptidase (beta-lactamase class C family)
MKKIIKVFIIGLFLIFSSATAQTWKTIDSLLTDNITKYNGNVVTMIVHNDTLVYYKALGEYDSTTVKGIASLTKTFSGVVILKLAQEGYFNLDDSLGKYIPYSTQMGKGHSTIRQNFSHTGGWDGITGNTYLTDPKLSLEECVDSIITYDPLIYESGTMFKYTGVSMQVAARAVEIATNEKWNTLWTNKIKEPLGLNSTQFGFIDNPRVAGGLVSSPADILRLAQFILNNGKQQDGTQLIDPIWMDELWKDQTNRAPIIATPYPFSPEYNNPYNADTIRYGIGTWLDIYNPKEKYQEQISGGGAFGSIMWVNRCNNSCGVIFTYSNYSKVVQTSFQIIDVVNSIYPNNCYRTSFVLNKSNNEISYITPNPASDYIEINLDNVILSEAKNPVKIYNTFGECVMTVGVELALPKNEWAQQSMPLQRIDISHLPAGLYFIQIGYYSEKFMVVR